jgi:hypothetical protein
MNTELKALQERLRYPIRELDLSKSMDMDTELKALQERLRYPISSKKNGNQLKDEVQLISFF